MTTKFTPFILDLNVCRQLECRDKVAEQLNRADILTLRSALQGLKIRTQIMEYDGTGNDIDTLRDALAEVGQNLAELTDVQYVRDLWDHIGKTNHFDKQFGHLKEVLAQAVYEETVQGRNPRPQKWLEEEMKLHYRLYEPMEYASFKQDWEAWRKALLSPHQRNSYHHGLEPSNSHIRIWCPVLRDFQQNSPRVSRVLTQIVPKKVGEKNLCVLFGIDPDLRPLSDPGNLLYLDRKVEAAFVKGDITFVPISDSTGSGLSEHKVVIVNRSILQDELSGGLKWSELDERQLQFRNKERPSSRNIYLHNVLTFLRAGVERHEGHETLDERLFSGYVPEPFLRGDLFKWLAENRDCKLPKGWTDQVFMSGTEAYPLSPACLERRLLSTVRRFEELAGLVQQKFAKPVPLLQRVSLEADDYSSDDSCEKIPSASWRRNR